MSLTEQERFTLDLEDSGRSYAKKLKEEVAVGLLKATHNSYRHLGYKPARNHALEDALLEGSMNEDEWDAYKDFVDRRFQRRAREALRRKHIPFAPADAE